MFGSTSELVMRHLGILQEKVEINHRATLERVLESRSKAGKVLEIGQPRVVAKGAGEGQEAVSTRAAD